MILHLYKTFNKLFCVFILHVPPKLSAILEELLREVIELLDPVVLCLADSVILFCFVAMDTDVVDDELLVGLTELTPLGLDCPSLEEAVLGRET